MIISTRKPSTFNYMSAIHRQKENIYIKNMDANRKTKDFWKNIFYFCGALNDIDKTFIF